MDDATLLLIVTATQEVQRPPGLSRGESIVFWDRS
jgi:hypothetical protein